ncbi:hypothetical protein SAMN02745116_01109 [Pilibacter termitis]|uniref:Uncharacterized protein n=1 Tax=Pilibacter termitis TaxID=263852 RepID=A0A1T4MIV4_9ENTE|nr:hypothetical protein [Pilibacter termitis]SJZ66853.1 hypothetical protein SAMN02745116_01109 [Pilibacter termitis]
MKKIIIAVGVVVLAVGGFFAYKHFTTPNVLDQVGEKQLLSNTSGEVKTFNIKKEGYYDVTTLKSSSPNLLGRVPKMNETTFGQYFEEGEKVALQAGEEVEFQPAKFEKLAEEDAIFTLKDAGSYLIGTQFSAGKYRVSLEKELAKMIRKDGKEVNGVIQLLVYKPNDFAESESYSLNNQNSTATIELPAGKLLAVKSAGLEFELKFKK